MNNASNPQPELPVIDALLAKFGALRARLKRVASEPIPLGQAIGRVVTQDILAFRDSPAIDVSAMDGYAIRLDDLDGSAFRVIATATAGSAPVQLDERTAVRVFTGGPVPPQAQCVVRREDCNESETYVSICVPKNSLCPGQNIRRQGENARKGSIVVAKGSLLDPCQFSGAISFSEQAEVQVARKVRIGIINTGDELIDFGKPIQPWQVRDSNGPFLEAMLQKYPWAEVTRTKVLDQQDETKRIIEEHLERCDVLLLTGGVSMGDTDFVPDAIQSCGCKTVFHRLPIRPGRPLLGAVGPNGQLILGLPGNPLSVAVTFRRFGLGLIQYAAGFAETENAIRVQLTTSDTKTIDLTWFRLVQIQSDGRASLVPSQGSGDVASLAQSHGFVEIPTNTLSAGERTYYAW